MPTLETLAKSRESVRMLMMGDSGSGKTGALACLAEAGYNLHILDFDAGAVDILTTYVDKKHWPNIEVIVLTDKMRAQGVHTIPVGQPKAFAQALALMTNWRYWIEEDGSIRTKVKPGVEPDVNLGPLESWGPKDILVIDSFSFMGMAAFRYVLFANSRGIEAPYQSDWGEAQRLLEGVLQMISDSTLRCQVIINTHVTIVEPMTSEGDPLPKGIIKGLPAALGKALSPKMGAYFNTTLLTKTRGTGSAARRQIHCLPEGLIELKLPAKNPPRDLPISDGLLQVFKLLLEPTEYPQEGLRKISLL